MQLTVPPSVMQNIARVKSLLTRDEPIRAIDALLTAIQTFESAQVLGRARSGTEVAIQECVDACNGQAQIRKLLRELARSDKAAIVYVSGEEAKLAGVLRLIRKALAEAEAVKEREAQEAHESRKEGIIADASAAFRAGEAPKGRAILRRLGDDFGAEPGVFTTIAAMLTEAGFILDAVPYLEAAIEAFPRTSEPYGKLASSYMELREFGKAEKVYLAAIREFGAHPKTLTNLGKAYIAWNRRDKASVVLRQAARQAPEDKELAELLAKVDR